MNTPKAGQNNATNGISKFFAASLLAVALTTWLPQTTNAQTTPEAIKNGKVVIAYTKLTVSEMEDWVSWLLVIGSGEADALNNSEVMKDDFKAKIIDNLIDRCKRGILSRSTTKGAIFLLAKQEMQQNGKRTQQDEKKAIGLYLKLIEPEGLTTDYLQEIIYGATSTASLKTIKK